MIMVKSISQMKSLLSSSKAVESYGIVGMASRQQVRDGIAEILGHENYARGIEVKENNGVIDIDMYIIVSYGVKFQK